MTDAADASPSEIFNPSDFASDVFTVVLQNTTSRTDPLSPHLVSLQELDEQSLVLGLPKVSCNVNHNVSLEICRENSKGRSEPLWIRATGKVIEVEETDDKTIIRARINLIQFDEGKWRLILGAHESRQEAISKFLMNARG